MTWAFGLMENSVEINCYMQVTGLPKNNPPHIKRYPLPVISARRGYSVL
jgi:hypothetical protein